VNPWQPQELGAFLDHIAADPFAPIYELMAMAGLRRGEAAGLRWSDLDLSEGFLVVHQQIVQLDGQAQQCAVCGGQHVGMMFTPPKTSSGEARRVDLGSSVTGCPKKSRRRPGARPTRTTTSCSPRRTATHYIQGGGLPSASIS
jgi:integrase